MIRIVDYAESYTHRAAGWVQDSSDFSNLHRFVSAFSPNSQYKTELLDKIQRLVPEDLAGNFITILNQQTIKIAYRDIVGSAPRGSRKLNTVCNGIGQAALKGQTREFQGDWPTNNFLRWAEVLQFIVFDPATDSYSITDVGEVYARAVTITDQYDIIKKQILMYPPAVRVLNLLAEGTHTKFSLGEQLGFIGEKGFTNVSEKLFVDVYFSSEAGDRARLKSDYEGSSDKYARQICSWLMGLGLVEQSEKEFASGSEILSLKTYALTAQGRELLRKTKIETRRFVPFGMLSMEASNSESICKRRALVLKSLSESAQSLNDIVDVMQKYGAVTRPDEVADDIVSLRHMGLNIERTDQDTYKLKDTVNGLNIPRRIATSSSSEVLEIKERLRSELKYLDHNLLVLIDFAYGSSQTSRLFETYVARVYEQIYSGTFLLGGVSKPDVVVCGDDYVIIIDTKAYQRGFSFPVSERDKMVRYIEEYKDQEAAWYKFIKKSIKNHKALYQFVSPKFLGDVERNLRDITRRTQVQGIALAAENLLRIVDHALASSSQIPISELTLE